jgi:hypothetical protein
MRTALRAYELATYSRTVRDHPEAVGAGAPPFSRRAVWQHTADGRGRARYVPDQAVAYGGERSLMGAPTSRLTSTIVVKAVPEEYS